MIVYDSSLSLGRVILGGEMLERVKMGYMHAEEM